MRTRFSNMSVRASFVIAAALGAAVLAGAAGPETPPVPRDPPPLHAVIDGHPVQPRASQLRALGDPDVTAPQAAEVDKLYHQLMQNNHVDALRQTNGADG
jgi:hypothetical protein